MYLLILACMMYEHYIKVLPIHSRLGFIEYAILLYMIWTFSSCIDIDHSLLTCDVLFYYVPGRDTDMGSEHYCLRWNNHQNNLLGVFSQLLHDESLVDVTLACSEGHSIRAHKVVLSACSSYFQSLFIDHPSRHPIVILKDVCFSELRTLIEFMYRGEVNVEYCQLSTLLKTAESLKVKGLAEMTQDLSTRSRTAPPSQENESSSAEPPAHSTALQQRLEASPPVIELTTIKRRLSSEDERNTPSPRPQTPSPPPDCPEPSNLSLKEDRSPSPPDVDDVSSMQSGPSDMTLNSRIPSPLSGEPVPGPSGLPPVQQVPLVSTQLSYKYKYKFYHVGRYIGWYSLVIIAEMTSTCCTPSWRRISTHTSRLMAIL